jgi:hypothetical protein
MTSSEDKIWAYLHNELAGEEKVQFELALENSPELRKELDSRRLLHNELNGMSQDELTDDQLENLLLEEWEAEHPELREPEKVSSNRILRLVIPLAAAAVIVLVAMPLRPSPIDWQRTAYGTAPQLRGQLETRLHYRSTELKRIDRALRLAIETEVKQLPEPIEPWQLKIHLQELAAGALAIEISGHPVDHPEASRIWNLNFKDMETCIDGLPMVGKQVANEL